MQADGFLNRHERHPVALTVAIGLNLAAVTALLLAKGEAIPLPDKIIEVINIPLEKPKDVPPPPPIEKRVERPIPTVPDRIVDRPVEPDDAPLFAERDWTIVPGGGGGLSGTSGTIDPPYVPPPVPVLTDAAPDPRFASLFQPPYPPRLQRLDIEGKVVLKVLIGADGRVREVQIVYADDDGFAEVTERQALTKWRFKPATRDGVAVETWKQMTVRFEIRRG
jgi:periplasmic protein TonB